MLLQIDSGKLLELNNSKSLSNESKTDKNTTNVQIDTSSSNNDQKNVVELQHDLHCQWFYPLQAHQKEFPVCPVSHKTIGFLDKDKDISVDNTPSSVLVEKNISFQKIDWLSELPLLDKCDVSLLNFQSEHRVCTAVEYLIRTFKNVEKPNARQLMKPKRELKQPLCKADQSYDYMNIMQTVGVCFDSDFHVEKSRGSHTKIKRLSKDVTNVGCMKKNYKVMMQDLPMSTCHDVDIKTEQKDSNSNQVDEVVIRDLIDKYNEKTVSDISTRAEGRILHVSANAPDKVEFLSLLLTSWYPHTENTPAKENGTNERPKNVQSRLVKHTPRNDTSWRLDNQAGNPQIPGRPTDQDEPGLGKETVGAGACPNKNLIELYVSAWLMCSIAESIPLSNAKEQDSTDFEIARNSKDIEHVSQDDAEIISKSSQVGFVKNNLDTTPWSTLSAFKLLIDQDHKCLENQAKRSNVSHDEQRKSRAQGQYCSRPSYIDLLASPERKCLVQQKTIKPVITNRSTSSSCSNLKRYIEILIARNELKFCTVHDFSVAKKVTPHGMPVKTCSKLDGYRLIFTTAYKKEDQFCVDQSVLKSEEAHSEQKSGSIHSLPLAKKLIPRRKPLNTSSKFDGYRLTFTNANQNEDHFCVDQSVFKSEEARSKQKSGSVRNLPSAKKLIQRRKPLNTSSKFDGYCLTFINASRKGDQCFVDQSFVKSEVARSEPKSGPIRNLPLAKKHIPRWNPVNSSSKFDGYRLTFINASRKGDQCFVDQSVVKSEVARSEPKPGPIRNLPHLPRNTSHVGTL